MTHELLVRAWRKIRKTPPPDSLPASLLVAFVEMLPPRPQQVVGGYSLGSDLGLPADPWGTMVVGHDPELALLAWVLTAARLVVIGRGPEESWLALDCEIDADGEHRVYEVSADGLTATPLFESLTSLLGWLEAPKKAPKKVRKRSKPGPGSVESALPLLWQLHPAELFQSYRAGRWSAEVPELEPFAPPCPGWRRQALIWTLAQFRSTRTLVLHPHLSEDDLDELHLELNEHLKDLEEAMHAKEVPILVAELSLAEDDELATAAMEWMFEFDQAHQAAEETTSSDLAEKTRGMLSLLQAAIDELIRLEHIEVEDTKKQRLSEELLEAVLKAGSPEMAVPYLIEALLESQQVDEVYASDYELGGAISAALGMSK